MESQAQLNNETIELPRLCSHLKADPYDQTDTD